MPGFNTLHGHVCFQLGALFRRVAATTQQVDGAASAPSYHPSPSASRFHRPIIAIAPACGAGVAALILWSDGASALVLASAVPPASPSAMRGRRRIPRFASNRRRSGRRR